MPQSPALQMFLQKVELGQAVQQRYVVPYGKEKVVSSDNFPSPILQVDTIHLVLILTNCFLRRVQVFSTKFNLWE